MNGGGLENASVDVGEIRDNRRSIVESSMSDESQDEMNEGSRSIRT